jgi:acyl-CoA reductase-like NAD-dependent aldehyde dehydrogenase
MPVDEAVIARIVGRVVERLAGDQLNPERPSPPAAPLSNKSSTTTPPQHPAPRPVIDTPGRMGIFEEIDQAVAAAREAFLAYDAQPPSLRARVVQSVRERLRPEIENLARLAVTETGYGRIEDKVFKNTLAVDKTPGTEILIPEAASGDFGLTLIEPAPYGVIAAITPVTNPTETIICNAIGMLAGGNTVVVNPHPAATQVSIYLIDLLNRAAVAAGGPPHLVTAVSRPTIGTAQELMHHPDVRLLVVTGGEGVVREAMTSGKKAICAGPGNPPVVVDETADLDQAARDIVAGASLDNNIVCVVEKEIIAVETIADDLLTRLKKNGAYVLQPSQLDRLCRVIFNGDPADGKINLTWVGQDAAKILGQIGVEVGDDVRLVVAGTDVHHPLVSTEQLMPVIPLVRVKNAAEAIDVAVRVERGCFHTAVMHSKNIDNLSAMARKCNTTIFVKNGPSFAGLGLSGEGFTSFSIASPTGEGVTHARHFTRARRCTLKDSFRIV